MKDAVLLSIYPKYCELILNGSKTVEIRKNKPNLPTPFKCYVYCTRAKSQVKNGGMILSNDELYRLPNGEIKYGNSIELATYEENEYSTDNFLNRKVIAEFTCTGISEFQVFENGSIQYWNRYYLENSCLPYDEVARYIGNNRHGYAWEISNVKAYSHLMNVSDFRRCKNCKIKLECSSICDDSESVIYRPPWGWCYCGELK